MLINTRFSALLFSLALPSSLLLGACSVSSEPELTKLQASQKGGLVDGEDACAAYSWYGDRECDTFCVDADTDCAVNPVDPVVCALFIEEPDKVCSRPDDDPCRMQDPDCTTSTEPYPGDGDLMCAAYIELADGVCKRKEADPCRFQDADCTAVNCSEYMEVSDGVCSRDANDGCRFQDPDCQDGVVCAAYVEDSDGVCSRSLRDECRSQDPDCVSNPSEGCEKFVEESDGTCGRPDSDPCRLQDPDCGSAIQCKGPDC